MNLRRAPQMARWALLGVGLALRVSALESKSDLATQEAFKLGMALMNEAEKATTAAAGAVTLRQAAEQFQRAAEARPDFYADQLMWAHCLSRLVKASPELENRQSLAHTALERFRIASQCTDTDWRVYHGWAMLLTADTDDLAKTATDARALLAEARRLLEKSRAMTGFSVDTATVERDSAVCLIAMAERATQRDERCGFYREAIAQFESADKRAPKQMTSRHCGLWGVALLQLGKIGTDRMLMRQATERLLTALEMDSTDSDARYNLVCAYALLDQPDNALRHLRLCLDHDPQRTYYQAAAKDPDLWSLRRTAEYNAIFNPPAPTDAPANPQPSIQ